MNWVRLLLQLGYQFHEFAQHHGIEDDQWDEITPSSQAAKDMLRAYQQHFGDEYEALGHLPQNLGGLNRSPVIDGEFGPVSNALLNTPRCGEPDFFHPNAATEQANHPDRCRHELTYSFQMQLAGMSQTDIRTGMDRAIAQWRKHCKLKCSYTPSFNEATRYCIRANLGGSVLADQYLANNTCGGRFRGRFDNRQWTPQFFTAVDGHEVGHFWGLRHESRDRAATMWPSIHQATINRWGAPNDSDVKAMLRIGYERQTGDPPDDPGDPPDGDWQKREVTGGVELTCPHGDKYALRIVEHSNPNP